MGLQDVDKSIRQTKLWKLLEQKIKKEELPGEFLTGVETICSKGITLAKDIIRLFPTFTLHDNVHICNVCVWMYKLLGSHAKELTAADTALLVMSAACHDIGMSVSEEQKAKLAADAKRPTPEWERYFLSRSEEQEEFQRTGEIPEKMLRNYVRLHHHERVALQLPKGEEWPAALTRAGASRDVLLRLCTSHGKPLEALQLTAADKRSSVYHLLPCAILLRLADLLDFDASRAPKELYHHLGLDDPKDVETAFSKMEWDKNCAQRHLELADGVLAFQTECASMQVEHEVRAYMDWVQREMDECSRAFYGSASYWNGFQPPYKVEVEIRPEGYKSGPFCLTMEQDRILELLAGKNLYSDPGVFVRELLQNSIDAVRTRVAQDPAFGLEDGRIVIHTWMDNDGFSWFRIEDNGTGMDQEIILNHFLKVGSSFYNSDRFKAELKKCRGKGGYTPISRFGIGILSCFMSDPEHNRLQMSTKRFPQAGSPAPAAIRMNVDGLHGYYYLAEEGAQSAESDLLTMSHPAGEDDGENGYRSEAGTTICVRLNLYQLGGFRTLKELVDRYVQFPELRVEYHGQEGDFVYPTQQKLMEEVHTLNPDGEGNPPKEYCYYLSDEEFDELKAEHPEIVWETEEKPGIAIKYCPLDWMTPGDQVSGVAVVAEAIKPKCHIIEGLDEGWPDIQISVRYSAQTQQLEFTVDTDFSDEVDRKMENIQLSDEVSPEERNLLNIYEWAQWGRNYKKEFSYVKLSKGYLHMEGLSERLDRCGQESVDSRTIVAFNGILADQSHFLGQPEGLVGLVVLLGQHYRPEVNLARDTISELPLEGAAVLSVLQKKLGFYLPFNARVEAFQLDRFILKTEQELQEVLDNLPAIKNELRLGPYTLSEAEKRLQAGESVLLQNYDRGSLYDLLCLAAAKQMGTVVKDMDRYSDSCFCNTEPDRTTRLFPTALFFSTQKADARLGVTSWNLNCYNKEHRFSRWLIAQQKGLIEKVPGIYNVMLKAMIMENEEDDLRKELNDNLTRLQNIPGNPFGVTDDLFLTVADFV